MNQSNPNLHKTKKIETSNEHDELFFHFFDPQNAFDPQNDDKKCKEVVQNLGILILKYKILKLVSQEFKNGNRHSNNLSDLQDNHNEYTQLCEKLKEILKDYGSIDNKITIIGIEKYLNDVMNNLDKSVSLEIGLDTKITAKKKS